MHKVMNALARIDTLDARRDAGGSDSGDAGDDGGDDGDSGGDGGDGDGGDGEGDGSARLEAVLVFLKAGPRNRMRIAKRLAACLQRLAQ